MIRHTLIIGCLTLCSAFLIGQSKTFRHNWDTPFYPHDQDGTQVRHSYAIGPNNMEIGYDKSGFKNSYPAVQFKYHDTYKKRLVLKNKPNASTQVWIDFKEGNSNSKTVENVFLEIHDIDDSNIVSVFGKTYNGVVTYPTYLNTSGSTYNFLGQPNDLSDQVSGNGQSSINLEGTVKVYFSGPLEGVFISFSDNGGGNSDREIVIDDIWTTINIDSNVPDDQYVFDWDQETYTAGEVNQVFPPSFASPIQWDFGVLGAAGNLNSGYPQDNADYGKISQNGSLESWVVESNMFTNDLRYFIEPSAPVNDLNFTIGDIDNKVDIGSSESLVEQVKVIGYREGKEVYPYLYSETGGSSYVFLGEGQVRSHITHPDQIINYYPERGMLNVLFQSEVDRVEIIFENTHYPPGDLIFDMAISSLNYSTKEVEYSTELEGYIFHDLNNNGYDDSNDAGLTNFKVELHHDSNLDGVSEGVAFTTITSDGNADINNDGIKEGKGKYLLKADVNRNYFLKILPTEGFYPAVDPDGNNDNMLSIETGNTAQHIVKPYGYKKRWKVKRNSNIVENENSIHVYPNPTHGRINLSFNVVNAHNAEVHLLDVYGKLIVQKKLSNTGIQSLAIDISENVLASNQVLFLRMFDGKEWHVEKIIVFHP